MGPEGRTAVGIGDGTVRVLVGLEAVEDIADDLTAASTSTFTRRRLCA